MSFSDTIALAKIDTTTESFVEVSRDNKSTLRSVAGRPLDEPHTLKISHETSGKKTNTAVMLDRTKIDADEVTVLNARVLVKLTYDSGMTAADIEDMVRQVANFISDNANIVKLENKEH